MSPLSTYSAAITALSLLTASSFTAASTLDEVLVESSCTGGHCGEGRRKLNVIGTWMEIFNEDFEHGTAGGETDRDIGPNFQLPDTGDNVAEHYGTMANSESRYIMLRHNAGDESSLTSRSIDVSQYSHLEVSFYHRAQDLETMDNMYMELRYNNAGPWLIAKDMHAGANGVLVNEKWYSQCLHWYLYAGRNTTVDTLQFRFRSNGDDLDDVIYIDDVEVNGLLSVNLPTDSPSAAPSAVPSSSPVTPTVPPTESPLPKPRSQSTCDDVYAAIDHADVCVNRRYSVDSFDIINDSGEPDCNLGCAVDGGCTSGDACAFNEGFIGTNARDSVCACSGECCNWNSGLIQGQCAGQLACSGNSGEISSDYAVGSTVCSGGESCQCNTNTIEALRGGKTCLGGDGSPGEGSCAGNDGLIRASGSSAQACLGNSACTNNDGVILVEESSTVCDGPGTCDDNKGTIVSTEGGTVCQGTSAGGTDVNSCDSNRGIIQSPDTDANRDADPNTCTGDGSCINVPQCVQITGGCNARGDCVFPALGDRETIHACCTERDPTCCTLAGVNGLDDNCAIRTRLDPVTVPPADFEFCLDTCIEGGACIEPSASPSSGPPSAAPSLRPTTASPSSSPSSSPVAPTEKPSTTPPKPTAVPTLSPTVMPVQNSQPPVNVQEDGTCHIVLHGQPDQGQDQLGWNDFTSKFVDIYRDGVLVTKKHRNQNNGKDKWNDSKKGKKTSYEYKVCVYGSTSECCDPITIEY